MDNPVANWVEAIAAAKGDRIGWEQQIGLGSPIRVRTRGNDPGATAFTGYARGKNRRGRDRDILAELASPSALGPSETYDVLVITERHNILGTLLWEGTIPYLRDYHDRLLEQDRAARTYFYQSWWQIDKDDPQPWLDLQRIELIAWECAASKVNLSLQEDGHPRSVVTLPTAVALARLVERAFADAVPGITGSRRQKLDAIFGDDVHLNPPGQYLMSAVIYAGVFGKSPVGANAVPTMGAKTAAAIEEIAWEVVSTYEGERGANRSMEECRTLVSSKVCQAYFGFRKKAADCDLWKGPKSPYKWPDKDLAGKR